MIEATFGTRQTGHRSQALAMVIEAYEARAASSTISASDPVEPTIFGLLALRL